MKGYSSLFRVLIFFVLAISVIMLYFWLTDHDSPDTETFNHEQILPIEDNLKSKEKQAFVQSEFNDKTTNASKQKGVYYLSSIIFSHSDNWSVWVNDQRLTPQMKNNIKGLKIVNVTADYVEFLVPQGQKICLKCDQTINISNGLIHNGDCREMLDDVFNVEYE